MSSSSDPLQNSFDSYEPKQELESPFLNEEYLADEARIAQWRVPATGFQPESPFLEAFEEGWGLIGEVEEFEEFLNEMEEELEEEEVFTKAEDDEYRESDFEAEAALQFFMNGISGADNRTEVKDTTIPPYRWICSVSYEKDGKILSGGTGVLISNRHVLTAGHVITEAISGPAAPLIYVYPGRHYGDEPFGRFSVVKTRVSTPTLDFGLITLEDPVDQSVLWWGDHNTKTAWWSEALLPAQQLSRTAVPISTASYPSVKDRLGRRMFEANGSTVPGAFSQIFRHTADTTQGQSGSPIWTVRNGLYILLGIVTGYDKLPGQRATWFGAIVRKDIERWMAEDVPKVERRIGIEIPYRWICRLEIYDNDLGRTVGFGTGLLISNRHVLTAARVIHDFSRDRRRYSIQITPGYEFGEEAFGSTTASKARLSPKFSPETKDGSIDYGLLTLSRPLGDTLFSVIGNIALGSWRNETHGLYATPADWSGKVAHMAAFSRSSGGSAGYHKLRVSTGAIVGLQRGQVLHKASSKLDAPGAPIWIEAGNRRLLVGIASSVFSKDSGLNLGCYLSQETQKQLMQWVNEDYKQTELEVRNLSQDELEFVLASPDTETEWSPELSVEEGDVITGVNYKEDELELLHEQPLEERFDPFSRPQKVADELGKEDWRDENELAKPFFFAQHPELLPENLDSSSLESLFLNQVVAGAGGSGSLGIPDFWPDAVYIVKGKGDRFLHSAREFHKSWGFIPVEFDSLEELIRLIARAPNPKRRIRVISHAWDGFKIPLFKETPIDLRITQAQIEALNSGDGELMDELLGKLVDLDQLTDQGEVTWKVLLMNLESNFPDALKPFGLSSNNKPSGDLDLLLRRCADLVAVASANPVFNKAVSKSIESARIRLKRSKSEVVMLEASVMSSRFSFTMSKPTSEMENSLSAAINALDLHDFRKSLKAARSKLQGKWIDFRGCRIGYQPKYLEAFAILMGTDGCSAPDLWSGYPGTTPINDRQVISANDFKKIVNSSTAAFDAMHRWGMREVTGWNKLAAVDKAADLFFKDFLVKQSGVCPVYEVDYSDSVPKEKQTLYWNSKKGKQRWLESMWDLAPKKQVQKVLGTWGANTPRMPELSLHLETKSSSQANPQKIYVVPDPEFSDHIIKVKKP
jgi:V8-like Glu-specific endopeptidase